jgi:hypothetical protein
MSNHVQVLRNIVEFAYEAGYHEPGYDVVAALLEQIRRRVGVSYEALGLSSDEVESLPPELRDPAKVRERGQELLKTGLTFIPADDFREWVEEWAKAYPLDVFPEPDFKRAYEILKAAGISLDCISAANMRHVITRVRDKLRGSQDEHGEKP